MLPTNLQTGLDHCIDTLVDYALSMGCKAFDEKLTSMVNSTDDTHARSFIATMGLYVMIKANERLKELEARNSLN